MTESTTVLPMVDACCVPLVREPITPGQAESLARLLKALADPVRLRLVSMVAAHADGEACVCDLTEPLGLTQPTVSHHLKILVDAGIFAREKRGVWAFYSLVPGTLTALSAILSPASAKRSAINSLGLWVMWRRRMTPCPPVSGSPSAPP